MRRAAALMALLAGSAAAPVVMADEAAPPRATSAHWDVGAEIPFEFDRGRVTTPLPFDVPFYLQAKVPEGTKKAEASYGAAGKSGCTASTPLPANLVKITQGTAKEPFVEISVPELHYSTDYCFAITLERPRTEAESARIREALKRPLAALYQTANARQVATLAGDAEFRRTLFRIISNAVAPNVVKPEPGSYLDLSSPGFRSADVRMLFQRPFESAKQTDEALEQYRNFVERQSIASALPPQPGLDDVQEELSDLSGRIAAATDDSERQKLEFAEEALQEVADVMSEGVSRIDAVAAAVEESLAEKYDVQATSRADYLSRFYWYVSADLGVAYGPDTDEFFEYLGANIYFRPVNKKAELKGWMPGRRFAVMVGLSANLTGDREGLIGGRPILLAGGVRITDHIRVAAGLQFFNADDPDPLVTRDTLSYTPFVSASIDWDVASTFRGLFSPLFPKTNQ